MSIVQEALKKAQYDFARKKSPPQVYDEPRREEAIPSPAEQLDTRIVIKKIAAIVYIIVLLALVTGFGIRALFTRILTMDKEKRSKETVVAIEKTDPDKAAEKNTILDKIFTGKMASSFTKTDQQVKEEPLVSDTLKKEDQAPDIILSGIMYTKENPKAIINGTVVREGDVISGATITSITAKNVLLKYNSKDNQVEVGIKLKE
jgi:hypothetical protein